MKTTHILGSVALVCFIAASPVWAQRVQFPTPVQSDSNAASAAAAPSGSVYSGGQPGAYNPSAPAASGIYNPAPATPYPAPAATAPPAGAYSSAPGAAAPYSPAPMSPPNLLTPPPTASAGAYAAPPAAAGAAAAPYGTPGAYTPPASMVPTTPAPAYPTQPPVESWDPYAAPAGGPAPLITQDPAFQMPMTGYSMTSFQKFIQSVNFGYDWFAGSPVKNSKELGINDIELSATCALPMFYNTQTPLLITPGFAVHYWAGPESINPIVASDPAPADLPPRTYDAYLDFGWNPQLQPWLGAELNFRTGIYSDFNEVTTNAMRYMGKGMLVMRLWPTVTVKAGVWYLDRVKIKMLPAGGIVWTPNPDVYFNILFPNPKIAKRLTTLGTTEWWIFASGDYGGGSWNVKRDDGLPPNPFYPDINGSYDNYDYNDIRIAGGLEFKSLRNLNGMIEVGLSCSRELVYQSELPPAFYPNNTVYIGASLAY